MSFHLIEIERISTRLKNYEQLMNKLISGFGEPPLRKKNERKESEYGAGKKKLFHSIGICSQKWGIEKNVKRDYQPIWLNQVHE